MGLYIFLGFVAVWAYMVGRAHGRRLQRKDDLHVVWDAFDVQRNYIWSSSSRMLCEMIEHRLLGKDFDEVAEWKMTKEQHALHEKERKR